jgi:hypothetical protein
LLFQHALCHPGVDGIVLHQENAERRQSLASGFRRRRWLDRRRALPHARREVKRAAPARLAIQPEVTAQQAYQSCADRQPQSRPSVLSRHGAVGLTEGLEYDRLLLFGNADARVRDGKAELEIFLVSRQQGDLNGDPTLLGELYGVARQIYDDLAQARFVSDEPRRDLGGDFPLHLRRLSGEPDSRAA